MFDKAHYEKLLQETLIKNGYLPNPSFEEKLLKILQSSFPYLQVKSQGYSWEDRDISEWTEQDFIEYEKCQPDYITSLPGDLRSTDPNLLRERLTEIENRIEALDKEREETDAQFEDTQNKIDELTSRNDELKKNLDDYVAKENQFIQDSLEVKKEATDEAKEIRDNWDEYGTPNNEVTSNMSVDDFIEAMNNFGIDPPLTDNNGLLTSSQVNWVKNLAENLETYAMGDEVDGGDSEGRYSVMSEELSAWAFSLEEYADKYDVNNHPLGETITEINNITSQGLPQQWAEEYSNNLNEINEQEKLLNDLGKLARKQETTHVNLGINHNQTTNRLEQVEKNE